MDTNNGAILSPAEVAAWREKFGGFLPPHIRPMEIDPTPVQLARGRVGRNEPCPCGSGRKFKYCCRGRFA